MSAFKSLIIFSLGATAGSFVTRLIVKKKYERIAQEEINSVKEVFSKRNAEVRKHKDRNEEKEFSKACDIIDTHGYINVNTKKKESACKPYVISPDDFGENDDYEKISLTYYSDGVLADDNDDIIEDIDSVVGRDSLTHFGEYEDDSVFVRNEKRRCDYEILIDRRSYSEVIESKPYLR